MILEVQNLFIWEAKKPRIQGYTKNASSLRVLPHTQIINDPVIISVWSSLGFDIFFIFRFSRRQLNLTGK